MLASKLSLVQGLHYYDHLIKVQFAQFCRANTSADSDLLERNCVINKSVFFHGEAANTRFSRMPCSESAHKMISTFLHSPWVMVWYEIFVKEIIEPLFSEHRPMTGEIDHGMLRMYALHRVEDVKNDKFLQKDGFFPDYTIYVNTYLY